VVDATARRHPAPAETGRIRVGAAAIAPDPLSSQGVLGALRSAVQGAAVVETMLRDGIDAPHAIAFHHDATERAASAHARFAADEHGRAASTWPTPFWTRRSIGVPTPGRGWPAPPAAGVPGDVALRWSEDARWQPTPVLDGPVIVVRPALHHPALAGPIAFAGDVDLSALRHAVAMGFDAVAARFGPAAAAALRQLCQRGVLVADAWPRSTSPSAATRVAS
jgi:hypothetical protein